MTDVWFFLYGYFLSDTCLGSRVDIRSSTPQVSQKSASPALSYGDASAARGGKEGGRGV